MTLKKQAITIFEMSIVVSIIAIMMTCVVVARDLIDKAKISAMFQDIIMYKNAISSFYAQNNCLPANCGLEFTKTLKYGYDDFGCSNSVTGGLVVKNDEAFTIPLRENDNSYKVVCAWMELQATGLIPAKTVSLYNKSANTNQSSLPPKGVAGYHVPIWKGASDAALFLFTDNFIFDGSGKNFNSVVRVVHLKKRIERGFHWIMTSFADQFDGSSLTYNNNASGTVTNSFPFYFGGDSSEYLSSTFSTKSTNVRLVSKMDSKYDDGNPSYGAIVAERDGIYKTIGSDGKKGCVILNEARYGNTANLSLTKYNTVNSKENGCNLAFLIDTLPAELNW